jgi:tetratricopeptide (TPR) repeat protein
MRLTVLVTIAISVLAGALSGLVFARLFRPDDPERLASTNGASSPVLADVELRLERIERRLDELTTRLGRARVSDPANPPAEPAANTIESANDLTRLRERLDKLRDQELLAEAKRLRRDKKDTVAARLALQRLLARVLSAKNSHGAFLELGVLERELGRLAEAEFAFRKAIDFAVSEGDERAWSGYELAMTLEKRGRRTDALAAAETALAVPGSGKWVAVHCRWAVATLSQAVGNIDRARAECERLLTIVGDDAKYRWCVEDVKARLARLR